MLRPTLWDLFHEGATRAVPEEGFVEVDHADNLNGFIEFEHDASFDSVMSVATKCQTELHQWGEANEVSFDPAKESVLVVSHAQPHGDSFKLLGVASIESSGWTCAWERW